MAITTGAALIIGALISAATTATAGVANAAAEEDALEKQEEFQNLTFREKQRAQKEAESVRRASLGLQRRQQLIEERFGKEDRERADANLRRQMLDKFGNLLTGNAMQDVNLKLAMKQLWGA